MVSIDGSSITGATIDGAAVTEITIDGTVAWTATTGASVTVTSSITGATATMTWYEDTDHDGIPENAQTFTLTGGTESFSLDNFSDDIGGSLLDYSVSSDSAVTDSVEITEITLDY